MSILPYCLIFSSTKKQVLEKSYKEVLYNSNLRPMLCKYYDIDINKFSNNKKPCTDIDKFIYDRIREDAETQGLNYNTVYNNILLKFFDLPAIQIQDTRNYRELVTIDKCTRCGYNEKKSVLHVHHIDHNNKNNNLNNLIVLCANCHNGIHNNEWYINNGEFIDVSPNKSAVNGSNKFIYNVHRVYSVRRMPKRDEAIQTERVIKNCDKCNCDIIQILHLYLIINYDKNAVLCPNCLGELKLGLWKPEDIGISNTNRYTDDDFTSLILSEPKTIRFISNQLNYDHKCVEAKMVKLEKENKVKRIQVNESDKIKTFWISSERKDITSEDYVGASANGKLHTATEFLNVLTNEPKTTNEVDQILGYNAGLSYRYLIRLEEQNKVKRVYIPRKKAIDKTQWIKVNLLEEC